MEFDLKTKCLVATAIVFATMAACKPTSQRKTGETASEANGGKPSADEEILSYLEETVVVAEIAIFTFPGGTFCASDTDATTCQAVRVRAVDNDQLLPGSAYVTAASGKSYVSTDLVVLGPGSEVPVARKQMAVTLLLSARTREEAAQFYPLVVDQSGPSVPNDFEIVSIAADSPLASLTGNYGWGLAFASHAVSSQIRAVGYEAVIKTGTNQTCRRVRNRLVCWGDTIEAGEFPTEASGFAALTGGVTSFGISVDPISGDDPQQWGHSRLFYWGEQFLGPSDCNLPTEPHLWQADFTAAVTQVSSRGRLMCAVVDNRVRCFNRDLLNPDAAGHGGAAWLDPCSFQALPITDTGDSVVRVAAGVGFACAVRSNRKEVVCWGTNEFGQLGRGNTTSTGNHPDNMGENLIAITFDSEVRQIEAGWHHTCAVLENGNFECWGLNENGQLGKGDTRTRGDQAGEIAASGTDIGKGVSSIAVGKAHTCLLTTAGFVYCTGSNGSGQQGTGLDPLTPQLSVQPVSIPTTVIAITAGESFSCALLEDQSVMCWGDNNYGQLGIPMGDGPRYVPVLSQY